MRDIFFHNLFKSMDSQCEQEENEAPTSAAAMSHTAIHRHMQTYALAENMNGFKRMQMCRHALDALDRFFFLFIFFFFVLSRRTGEVGIAPFISASFTRSI